MPLDTSGKFPFMLSASKHNGETTNLPKVFTGAANPVFLSASE